MTAPEPRMDEIQAIVANHSKSPGGIYGPGSDVDFLLAELRKAREALGRVEAECRYLDTLADGDRHYAKVIRAAVAAAKETE